MNLLLDTHVWLWLQAEPRRLASDVLDTLRDPATGLFLSAASAWEIAIKHSLGELTLPLDPATYVPNRMERSGVLPLAVTQPHALAVSTLPHHHRDPFDRLLVAQARLEGMGVVTVDPVFRDYDVPIVWAAP